VPGPDVPIASEPQRPQWSFEVRSDEKGVQLRKGEEIINIPMYAVINFADSGKSGVVKQAFVLGEPMDPSRTEFRLYDIDLDGRETGKYTLIGSVRPARIV